MDIDFQNSLILDVLNYEQARVADSLGLTAIRLISNRIDIKLIKNIKTNLNIPLIVKCHVGHSKEAKLLEYLDVDIIDENENLKKKNDVYLCKIYFKKIFINGVTNLGQVLRRYEDGSKVLIINGNSIKDILKTKRRIYSNISKFSGINYETFSDNRDVIEFKNKENVRYETIREVAKLEDLLLPKIAECDSIDPLDISLLMENDFNGIILTNKVFELDNVQEYLQNIKNIIRNSNDFELISKTYESVYKL